MAANSSSATHTWTGGGGNVLFNTSGNWSGGIPVSSSTTDLVFTGTTNTGTAGTPLNQNIATPLAINTVTFDAAAGSFFLGGGAFSFGGLTNAITQNSSVSQSIANNISSPGSTSTVLTLAGNGTGVVTLGGIISSGNGSKDYSITKSGSSTFTLSGANTYNGATTINGGVLNIRHASALGSTSGGSAVASGAALQLQGGIAVGAEALTLNGSGISNTGALRNMSGNNSFGGGITLASATTVGSDSGNLTLSGVVSGNFSLTKTGAGTLTLTNTGNTFAGTITIKEGTFSFGAAVLGNTSNSFVLGANATTGTLQYTGTGGTTNRAFALATGGTGALDITIGSATLMLGGVVSGSGALTKTGAGTVTLNAANTYTGATNVIAGTLSLGSSASLASAVLNVSSGATFSDHATATLPTTLALTARGNVTFNAATRSLSSLDGASTGVITLNGTNLTATSGSYAGVLQNGTSAGSLTKNGNGTMTLTGANTFTGATNVLDGTLIAAAGSGGALGATTSITVNNGGTLLLGASNQVNNAATVNLGGGTIAKGNFSEGSVETANTPGFGALTLTSTGSTLDFGSGSVGTLVFASLTPGTFTLAINNWTGTANTQGSGTTDRLIFQTSLSSETLASFSFTGYQAGATQFDLGGGYYEVTPMTPVPEPSTYFAAALAFAVLLFSRRGRQLFATIILRQNKPGCRETAPEGPPL